MNILFMSELFHPHGGGAELATYLYAKLLSEAGFNIKVITNKFVADSEISKNQNWSIHRLNLFRATRSLKYSTLQRVDVLLSSFMRKTMRWADLVYIPRFWFSAIPLARAIGKPVLVHIHDYIPVCPIAVLRNFSSGSMCNPSSQRCSPKCIYIHEREQGKSKREVLSSTLMNSLVGRNLSRLIELSDSVICVSNAQAAVITGKLPALRRKIQVVYNPLPYLSQTEIISDDFGYIGGPGRLKGFHTLCLAIDRVKNKRIKVRAAGFGNPSGHIDCEPKHRLVLHERLTGQPFEEFWKQIRALIVPSICCEPLPYAVAEAMLRGRILIASDVGGIPEQTVGCKGAFLVKPQDYDQLAETVDFVSNMEREKVIDLGLGNREVFIQRFNNESIVKSFIDICERLI